MISLDKWKDNCVLLYRLCNKPGDFANSDLHLRMKVVLLSQQCELNNLTTYWRVNSNSVAPKYEKGLLFLLDWLFPLSHVGRVCATLNLVKITCSLMLLPSARPWWGTAGGLCLALSISLQEMECVQQSIMERIKGLGASDIQGEAERAGSSDWRREAQGNLIHEC